MHEDGKPFFYLGDTAWDLFPNLSKEDADLFLTTRAKQKYNVIQAVVLGERDNLVTPNNTGYTPLIDCDPTRPNEAYFKHVDWVIQRGVELGLWWGLLPTWGDKWQKAWGIGPEIFTPENARIYGEWLGKRYRDVPLIWILGGDRCVVNDREREIMRGFATGLRAGDGGAHLMTYHPSGNDHSSIMLHNESWLDFNTIQSGHRTTQFENHRMIARDYALQPAKPTLDAEPPYEDHPDMLFPVDEPTANFDDFIVRRAAWQAVFSGACGHGYGCHGIWQYLEKKENAINRAKTPWRQAIHLPGAEQMQHLRGLMERMPFLDLVPDLSLVSAMPSGEPVHILRSKDKTLALIYFPSAGTRSVYVKGLQGKTFDASWYDPRTGETKKLPAVPTAPFVPFTPPAMRDPIGFSFSRLRRNNRRPIC